MSPNDLVAAMQSNTETICVVSGIMAPERPEYLIEAVLGNRRSIVPNFDHKIVVVCACGEAHGAIRETMHERIVEQVGSDLLQMGNVAVHRAVRVDIHGNLSVRVSILCLTSNGR